MWREEGLAIFTQFGRTEADAGPVEDAAAAIDVLMYQGVVRALDGFLWKFRDSPPDLVDHFGWRFGKVVGCVFSASVIVLLI